MMEDGSARGSARILQDRIVDMLHRHVEVGADAAITLHQRDQLIGDLIGIEVEHAEPKIAFFEQLFQK